MGFVRGFFRFWYDFLVGDDWKIAASVVSVLAFAAVLVATGALSESWLAVVAAAGVVAAFVASLVLDVR